MEEIRRHRARHWLSLILLGLFVSACEVSFQSGADDDEDENAAWPMDRDLQRISLDVDLSTREAEAVIRFAASESRGLSLRVGDLDILSVRIDGQPAEYQLHDADGSPATPARRLDIETAGATEVAVRYRYKPHGNFDGWAQEGYTFLWPRHCENLFPCETGPADGARYDLVLRQVPAGQTAIHAYGLTGEAPSYQPAWVVGDYRWLDLGKTGAGTRVRAAYLAGQRTAAETGTAHLKAVLDWYETRLGTYPWGGEAASVQVDWGAGAYGGMEHHPYWHIAKGDFDDPLAHTHEAAHGWFGAGVRLACWEDFVLSEGTASYLAAAATGATQGSSAEAAVWSDYRAALAQAMAQGDHPARPAGCAANYDVKNIYDAIPYYRGALFYKALEDAVGRAQLLDALRAFYQERRGQAAGMADMLATLEKETGHDPAALAEKYLYGLGAKE